MIRSWGVVTLTGLAQPVFGDVTTAAVGLPNGSGIIAVTVASTTLYRAGDRIVLAPGGADQDTLLVQSKASSTVLNCVSEGDTKTHTHISGTVIQLSIVCAEVLLTAVAVNSGPVWLGSDSTVTNVGGGTGFTYITAGGSYNLGFPQWNAIRSSEVWAAGTMGDKIGVAAVVV